MATRRALSTPVGQSLPWFVAALLVVAGSILVAFWLDTTGAKVDRDSLERGADAVEVNVEEQIRILELAGTGAQSLVGQSLTDIDIGQMLGQIDISVLASLLGVVAYPVDENGVGVGELLIQDLHPAAFPLPKVDATQAEIESLLATGDAFLSAPVNTTSPDRFDYVVALPVRTADKIVLVGVVFRIDRMLEASVQAAGQGQYAAVVVDPRYGDVVVASYGESVGELEASRSPAGLKDALTVLVRPGPDFPYSQSAWIPGLVIGTAFIIALLLVWMARMVKARAEDLEERLRLAHELNESKDRFLATVSHELRTPLTVVLGVASEVGPNWDALPNEDRRDLLSMMSEQAHEASNIVEDLLVAARSDPSQLRLALETTDLRPHIEYALASLPRDDLPRIKWSGISQAVEADTTRLRQIVRNLLENAVRYGGPEIEIRSWREESTVWLSVSDNGVRLEARDLKKIFEPYERSDQATTESPTGVGIGLYVSRLLARLMGGDLDCVRPRGATVFRLQLPAAVQPALQSVPERQVS